jgi:hypothetical protein
MRKKASALDEPQRQIPILVKDVYHFARSLAESNHVT